MTLAAKIARGDTMNYQHELSSNRSKEEVFLIRSVCIIGGIVYPLWGLIYQYILPEVDDPVSRRLSVTALAVFNIVLTYFPVKRSYLLATIYASMLVMTGHLVWIANLNGFHPYYQIGISVLVCVTVPFYQSLIGLMSYAAISSAIFLLPLATNPFRELFLFYMAISTVFLVSSYALLTRLNLVEKLRSSRQKFASSADQITAINRDISTIMQNIKLGVFTIESPDGKIGEQYSLFLKNILGESLPKHFTLFQLLKATDLEQDRVAQIRSLVAFIGEDQLQYELNSDLLPQLCRFKSGHDLPKTIEIEWSPVIDPAHGTLNKILVSFRDITELQFLRHENEEKSKELKLLSEIIAIDKKRIPSVFMSIKKLYEHCHLELQGKSQLELSSVFLIFREIHTIKGLARSFQLATLASEAHLAEDRLAQLKTVSQGVTIESTKDLLKPLGLCLQKYLNLLNQTFSINLGSAENVSFTRDEIDWIISNLKLALTSSENNLIQIQLLYDFLVERSQHSLKIILHGAITSLAVMAHDLQKPVPIIDIHDQGLSFSPISHSLLQAIFTHILRNAIDHGFEHPEERLKKGKTAEGHIEVTLSVATNHLDMYIQDDGQGLNLAMIREKASSKGLLTSVTTAPRKMLAEFIFLPDFSTKSKVSQVSGRGVGMDAVQAYIKGFGGSIGIELLSDAEDFVPFRFHIKLPLSLLDLYEHQRESPVHQVHAS